MERYFDAITPSGSDSTFTVHTRKMQNQQATGSTAPGSFRRYSSPSFAPQITEVGKWAILSFEVWIVFTTTSNTRCILEMFKPPLPAVFQQPFHFTKGSFLNSWHFARSNHSRSPVLSCHGSAVEGKIWGWPVGIDHCISVVIILPTQTMHDQRGNPSNLPYLCIEFDPPKTGNFMIPVFTRGICPSTAPTGPPDCHLDSVLDLFVAGLQFLGLAFQALYQWIILVLVIGGRDYINP